MNANANTSEYQHQHQHQWTPMPVNNANANKCWDNEQHARQMKSRDNNTVNPAVPVFHLFSLRNPDFIIYRAELNDSMSEYEY